MKARLGHVIRLSSRTPKNALEEFIDTRNGKVRLHCRHAKILKHPRRPSLGENPHADSRIGTGEQTV